MQFKLGKNIQIGNKLKTMFGWEVVIDVTDEGALTKRTLIKFGDTVWGWKAK